MGCNIFRHLVFSVFFPLILLECKFHGTDAFKKLSRVVFILQNTDATVILFQPAV